MTGQQPKRFRLQLSGQSQDAFAILRRFEDGARQHDWTGGQIARAMDEAWSGGPGRHYAHLLAIMRKYTYAR